MRAFLVNINGKFTTEDRAKISILDRGFLYGDSLYEVVRTMDHQPIFLNEHLERIWNSAQLAYFKLPWKKDFLKKQATRTLKKFFQKNPQAQEAYLRLILTRGMGQLEMGIKKLSQKAPSYLFLAKPLTLPTSKQLQKGLRLKVVSRLRNAKTALDPAMKSGNYLNNVLACIEAQKEGFDDALLCNSEGYLTEGTTFNIFYIKRKTLYTPPLSIGILHGITRAKLLQSLPKWGWNFKEVFFQKNCLYSAEEVFVTSTTRDLYPVTQIDHKKKPRVRQTLLLRARFLKMFQTLLGPSHLR